MFCNEILQKIKNSPIYKKCDVTLCGDLNIDLLQFSQHDLSNQYLELLLSASFLPIITNPTRIHKRSATLIDHIFSSKKANHYDSGIVISHISDHFPVFYIEESKIQPKSNKSIKTRKIDDESTASFCNILKTAPFQNRVTNVDNPKDAFDNFF